MPTPWGGRTTRWAVIAMISCVGAAPALAAADDRPMTFEDLLRDGRSLGEVRFSPSGAQLLASVERSAPSLGFPTKLTGVETFVWDLAMGSRRKVGVSPRSFTPALCEPWSPSGRFVAGFSPHKGERQMVAWHMADGRLTAFGDRPTTSCPAWAGDTLVYATSDPALPPAGAADPRRLAYMLGRWTEAERGRTSIVTVHSNNAGFPSPAPEGGALRQADPRTGQTREIAVGTFHSITPSPDGHLVAAVRLLEADPTALYSGRRGELSIFRLTSVGGRLAYRLKGVDPDYAGISWARDGEHLLVAGRDTTAGALALTAIDLEQGRRRRIPVPTDVRLGDGPRGAYSAFRPIGWIQDRPAFIAAKAADLPAPSDGHTDYGEGRGHSFGLFWDGPSGVRELTGFSRQSVSGFASAQGGDGYVVADGAVWAVGARPPRKVSTDDLTVTGLAPARPSLGLPPVYAVTPNRILVTARSRDGELARLVLDTASGRILSTLPALGAEAQSPDLASTARLLRSGWTQSLVIAGERTETLVTLNGAWRSRPAGEVRSLDYVVEGRKLRAWIVLPPGYEGGRLPTIVWVYGGQSLQFKPPDDALPGTATTPVFSAQLWAARGFAVLYPSLPFQAAANGDVAETLAKETLGAVDIAADQGLVDRDRVGLMGHSFGGFTTAAVLSKRSDRFRAGIAMSGAFDFAASWAARGLADELVDPGNYAFAAETHGYVEQGQIGLGGPPWAAMDAYTLASPFFGVTRITTPLMLTAGDLDLGSTSLLQSERMYAALLRTGNPAVLVRYWGQGHVQIDPTVVRDQWRRFGAWFDHYLRRPDDALPGAPTPAAERAHGVPTSIAASATGAGPIGRLGLPVPSP